MITKKKDRYFDIPKNYQDFRLVQKSNARPEDYGYTEEGIKDVLNMIKNDPNIEDDELQNDL